MTTKAQIQLLDNVKFVFYMWLKAKFTYIVFGYHDGWRSPHMCLDICIFLFDFML